MHTSLVICVSTWRFEYNRGNNQVSIWFVTFVARFYCIDIAKSYNLLLVNFLNSNFSCKHTRMSLMEKKRSELSQEDYSPNILNVEVKIYRFRGSFYCKNFEHLYRAYTLDIKKCVSASVKIFCWNLFRCMFNNVWRRTLT